MNYKILLLNIIMLVQPRGIQTQDKIEDEMNTTEVLPEEKNISVKYRRYHPIFTAGNTVCRANKFCGYDQETDYLWCYTDYSNNWDYCCFDDCKLHRGRTMYCDSGPTAWQYCGNGDTKDIQGRQCLLSHPCGMHQEAGDKAYYWCYVDLSGNWDKCCEPWHQCGKHDLGFNWCYTGRSAETDWQYCKL